MAYEGSVNTNMINSLSIRRFRGIEKLDISDIQRINLIAGRNNVGKSTLLEAIFLFQARTSPDIFMKLKDIRNFRAGGITGIWEPLFYQMDPEHGLSICQKEGEEEGEYTIKKDSNYLPYKVSGVSEDVLAQFRSSTKSSYSLLYQFSQGKYREKGHFCTDGDNILREATTNQPGNELHSGTPTRIIRTGNKGTEDFLIEEIGKKELSGEKKDIIQCLQEMDPSIEDIITVAQHGTVQLHIRTNGQWIPLQYAGDGAINLLYICLAILENKGGIVLIDEIENGLHYSMYKELWRIIDRLTQKANCQLFATTHSAEIIYAVQGNIEKTDGFAFYRLDADKGEKQAFRFSYDMMGQAAEMEMEVR